MFFEKLRDVFSSPSFFTRVSTVVPPTGSAQSSASGQSNRQPSSETITQALSGASGASASRPLGAMNVSDISGMVAETIAVSCIENTDLEDMKQREALLWVCVGKKKCEEGYIYRYQLRYIYDPISYPIESDKSDALIRNTNTISFPAVENAPVFQNKESRKSFGERELRSDMSQRTNDVIKELGYKSEILPEGVFAEFPDKEVIEYRWMRIMERHPEWNLKKLTIRSSENIAGDKEFIEAFYQYDVLLSTGREFVHDHQLHVLAKIEFIVESPLEYEGAREKSIQMVKDISKKIDVVRDWSAAQLKREGLSNEEQAYLARLNKNLKMADVIPAIQADTFAAIHSLEEMNAWFEQGLSFSDTISGLDESFAIYLKFRFPDSEISIDWLCNEIEKILKKDEAV